TQLSAEQLHYLRDVLRLDDDDEIEVFDGRGGAWRARLNGDSLTLVSEKLPEAGRAVDVVLAQAVARGEKMDLIVQKASELGAAARSGGDAAAPRSGCPRSGQPVARGGARRRLLAGRENPRAARRPGRSGAGPARAAHRDGGAGRAGGDPARTW